LLELNKIVNEAVFENIPRQQRYLANDATTTVATLNTSTEYFTSLSII
jgi:hypothetical protein